MSEVSRNGTITNDYIRGRPGVADIGQDDGTPAMVDLPCDEADLVRAIQGYGQI